MPKAKTKYPEIKDIQKDAKSLKKNITTLKDHAVQDIKETSTETYADLKDAAAERMSIMGDRGQEQVQKAETYIREKPLQSMGIALVAGAALSMLLKRR